MPRRCGRCCWKTKRESALYGPVTGHPSSANRLTPSWFTSYVNPHQTSGYRLGALALLVTLIVAALLPPVPRITLLGLLLALTAGIYMGFAWLDGRRPWLAIESLVGLALLGVALLGLVVHPLFIAAGFVAHVPWDLLHHKAIQTRIARWVPPACLLYDLGIALAILYWWPPL